MKRPITKRIISLTIITVMLITSMTVNLHASVGEEESIKTSDEAPDDAPPSEHSTEISQNEELSDVDNLESNNSEPNMLSDEQTDAKEQLQEDVSVLKDCEAGEDYVENELVVLCDSIEDAETIAEEYSETLGSEIALDDFEYGVATLVINDEEINVEDVVSLAADMDNSLVPVYPNYYEELCTVKTDNEDFSDPNTKINIGDSYNSSFQYFHEVIGSKYVWDAIDNNEIPAPDGYESFKAALNDTVVAVIDTGINFNGYDFHEATDSGEKSNETSPIYVGEKSFATEDASYPSANDNHGHGSNVAGIIADTANDFAGRGIASGVKIMPLKTMKGDGTGKTDWTLKALAYATEARKKYNEDPSQEGAYNVKVVNFSLGSYKRLTAFETIISKAIEQGIVICAAAGNYDNSASYYPAGYEGVICVGSVNSMLEKSYFSNYGSGVDVCAPGGESRRTYNYDKSEFNIASGQFELTESVYASGNVSADRVSARRGTSQATPMVSAAAALIMTRYPNLTPAEVESRIKSTATCTKENNLGAGCINVPAALGIVSVPDEPAYSIPSNTDIGTEADISLNCDNDDAVIYYTINGNNPDPSNPEATGTRLYIEENMDDIMTEKGIHLKYDGVNSSITLKAVTLLYGKLSNVTSSTYLFADKAVRDISISQKNNTDTIMVGKSLSLSTEIFPSYAANKKLVWTSSDTAIATVSGKGVVTAKAPCNTDSDTGDMIPVTITATAADGYGASDSFDIYVRPKTTKVEIVTTKTEELLKTGESFRFSPIEDIENNIVKNINIWPKTALNQVTYKSSNSKVVKVTADGTVTAVGSGTAVVTVTAADGSGKADSLKFRVTTPIYSISIRDKNTSVTKDKLAAGCRLTPVVTFNDGQSKPDNTTLKWSLESPYDANELVSINSNTGVVTAKSNNEIGVPPDITIKAVSETYGISQTYKFTVYQKTTNVSINSDKLENSYGSRGVILTKNTIYLPIKETVTIGNIIDIYPSDDSDSNHLGLNTMRLFSCASSNPVVASVPGYSGNYKDYYISANTYGKSTITLKALDGTGKTLKFNVVVVNENIDSVSNFRVGLKCLSGAPVYYPGKKLKIGMDNTHSYKIIRSEWKVENEGGGYSDILQIDANGTISKIKNSSNPEQHTIVTVIGKGFVNENIYNEGRMDIDVYPSATASVYASTDSMDKNGIKQLGFTRVGEKTRLYPFSLPESACQKYYTYSTSNVNVAKVYTDGTVEAVRNGTAYIYVKAGDGTGKKAAIKVTVAQDKATDIIAYEDAECSMPLKAINLSSIEMGAKNNSCLIDSARVKALPETAYQEFGVSTSNKKVATVSKEYNNSGMLIGYRITAVSKGSANIKFAADDGSKKSYTVRVNVTTPVNRISISSSTGTFIIKPGKALKLKAATNKASDTGVTWAFTEPKIMSEYATLNPLTGQVIAKVNPGVVYDTEHIVKVYAAARDYGGYTSLPVNIIISPSKVLMKNVKVITRDERDYMSSGTNLQMYATTTSDATNRKIRWALEDVDESLSERVSITTGGLIKTKGDIDKPASVTVAGIPLDGSYEQNGVIGKKKITIYPRLSGITITSVEEGYEGLGTDNHYVSVNGEDLLLNVRGYNPVKEYTGTSAPAQKFYITYKCTKGSGKAYLMNSDGTKIAVRGFSKGTMYVYATALDGTGKKATYKVTMQ